MVKGECGGREKENRHTLVPRTVKRKGQGLVIHQKKE